MNRSGKACVGRLLTDIQRYVTPPPNPHPKKKKKSYLSKAFMNFYFSKHFLLMLSFLLYIPCWIKGLVAYHQFTMLHIDVSVYDQYNLEQ